MAALRVVSRLSLLLRGAELEAAPRGLLAPPLLPRGCRRLALWCTGHAAEAPLATRGVHGHSRLLPGRGFHTSATASAAKKDYYQILGVAKDVAQKDIKKAYYQLAKKYHPDTNKEDPKAKEKFSELAEAYEVLSDDAKRKQYDTYGSAGFDAGFGSGAGTGGQQYWRAGSTVDPEELFRKIFGEFSRSNFGDFSSMFDQPQEFFMELTFTQAAKGVNKEISLFINDTCQRCEGRGNEPGTKLQRCHYCNGTGMRLVHPCRPGACVAGNDKHGALCDEVHVPPVLRQGHHHDEPVHTVPRLRGDQAEEDGGGARARRSGRRTNGSHACGEEGNLHHVQGAEERHVPPRGGGRSLGPPHLRGAGAAGRHGACTGPLRLLHHHNTKWGPAGPPDTHVWQGNQPREQLRLRRSLHQRQDPHPQTLVGAPESAAAGVRRGGE
ncbi:dnaJ homolog subfamily A member 3, mitochondrial isoform X3 [Lampetra planeri]